MKYSNFWQNGECIALSEVNALFFNYVLSRRGWVYIAYNRGYPGVLKVGRTSKTPTQRMRTLSSAGVLEEYECLRSMKFVDSHWAEARIHELLGVTRVRKEFFQASADDIYAVFLRVQREEMLILKDIAREKLLHAPSLQLYQS